jgi:hypothetical protein
MSVTTRQIKRVMEKALQKFLRLGHFPTFGELEKEVVALLGGKPAGFPLLKFRPAQSRHTARSQDFNAMIVELREDLELLYEEHQEQNQRLLTHYDYYDVERTKLERKINELSDKISELLLLGDDTSGYVASVWDNFRDLSKVNLNQTTAWVNLSQAEVTPPLSKGKNQVFDISQATVRVEVLNPTAEDQPPGCPPRELMPLENVKSNDPTKEWVHEVYTRPDFESEVIVKCYIDLDETLNNVNNIDLKAYAGYAYRIQVQAADAENNWRVLSEIGSDDYSVRRYAALNQIKQVSIQLSARNGQFIQVGNQDALVFHLGISSIHFSAISYENQGVFQSIPLRPVDAQGRPQTIGKMTLDVQESIPPGGEIRYEVSTDGQNWLPIAPISRMQEALPHLIDFKGLSSPNTLTIETGGDLPRITANGVDYYEIADLSSILAQESVLESKASTLSMGVNQFKRESFVADLGEDHIPDMTDWSNPTAEILYIDAGSSLELPDATSSHNIRLSTRIAAAKATAVALKLQSSGIPMRVSVYVDKVKIKTVMTEHLPEEVKINLSEGETQLTFLCYYQHQANPLTNMNVRLRLGVTPRSYGMIFAEKKIQRAVSLFELIHQVPFEDVTCYAVDGNKLYVNQRTKDRHVRFLYDYRWSTPSGQVGQLVLRATLTKDEQALLPPRLKSYALRIS